MYPPRGWLGVPVWRPGGSAVRSLHCVQLMAFVTLVGGVFVFLAFLCSSLLAFVALICAGEIFLFAMQVSLARHRLGPSFPSRLPPCWPLLALPLPTCPALPTCSALL